MMESVKVRGGVRYQGFKKGAGSARTPVETPDSLHSTTYAKILDLIGEGEIVGLENGLQSILLNKTPLQNPDGSMNFSGVTVDMRVGVQHQDYIPGFPASESPTSVGIELKYETPWVASLSNTSLSAVRITLGVNGLSKAITSGSKAGDIVGYRVAYAIDIRTDLGAWVQVVDTAFAGKTTDQYRRSHRIDLPKATAGWQIRVRRLTPQANSSAIADTTVIDSYSQIIDGKLTYPMSALVGLQIDASQFNSIPTRAYIIKGRIIKVPSNYNPETRIYTGTWDGTFKLAWTDNPAWIWYDIVTNTRYGLGEKIPAAWINKWELYRIGTYCDEFVPDGKGGQEPRFSCNVYLQTAADAYRVLQDLASVFRGIVYWAAGSAVAVADMPRDPSYIYTQANVENGTFTYTGSRGKDRPTVAIVSYNDPNDLFRQKTVSYQDDTLISRYGIRKVEISAFGCSSESQALRLAKYTILTSTLETQGVSFTVGLDGSVAAPGQIIKVNDNQFAGRRIGGRIVSVASASEVVLDAAAVIKYGDTLSVMMPDGTVETSTVQLAGGLLLTADDTKHTVDTTQITADAVSVSPAGTETITVKVSPAFTQVPAPGSVWALETRELVSQLFKVVSVTQGDAPTKFNIVGVQHEPGKYESVDYGTKIDTRPITVVPPSVQPPPTNVQITSFESIAQGIASTTVAISWTGAESAVRYQIEWRRDGGNWVRTADTATKRVEIQNAYSGQYEARVRAVNSIESPSLWVNSPAVDVQGYVQAPPSLTSLTASTNKIFGIDLKFGIPNVPNIIGQLEVRNSATNSFATSSVLTNLSYPQNSYTMAGLAAGATFYFWARLIDKNGLPGPWFPGETTGIMGKASSNADDILGYLTGQINETLLATELRTEIDKIPTIESAGQANAAAIQSEATTRANADSALSTRIDTAQATANGATASAQTALEATATTDGKLNAMYTVKVQLNTGNGTYQFAGFGVGIDNTGGVAQSQFLVTADRFAILPAGTSSAAQAASPFIVQGGQVFMRDAFIQNASIGSAKFQDWLESDAAIDPAGTKALRINFRAGDIFMAKGKLQTADGASYIDLNGTGSNYIFKFGTDLTYSVAEGLRINKLDVIDTLQIKGGAITSSNVINYGSVAFFVSTDRNIGNFEVSAEYQNLFFAEWVNNIGGDNLYLQARFSESAPIVDVPYYSPYAYLLLNFYQGATLLKTAKIEVLQGIGNSVISPVFAAPLGTDRVYVVMPAIARTSPEGQRSLNALKITTVSVKR